MERKIANSFIYPNKQERFLFELSRKSKDTFGELPRDRFNAICKLERIIDRSLSMMQSTKSLQPSEIINIMSTYGVKNNCYVMSEYKDFDGAYTELTLAIEKLQGNGFPSLIVGLPSGFSYFQGESFASTQPNFFMKPKIKFDNSSWNK